MTRGSPLKEQTGVTLDTRILSFAQKHNRSKARVCALRQLLLSLVTDCETPWGGPVGDPPRYARDNPAQVDPIALSLSWCWQCAARRLHPYLPPLTRPVVEAPNLAPSARTALLNLKQLPRAARTPSAHTVRTGALGGAGGDVTCGSTVGPRR